MSEQQITIVGAGIVGICCAIDLQEKGFSVTLIDRQQPAQETSFGNAGLFSSSNITPIASPDLISRIPRLLANLERDVHFHYSQLLKLTPWLIRFLRRCRRQAFLDDGVLMHAIVEPSIKMHLEWIKKFGAGSLLRSGSAMKLYRKRETYLEERLERELLDLCGVDYELLENREWLDREPGLSDIFNCAVIIKDTESVTNPGKLCLTYFDYFLSMGGRFEQQQINSLSYQGDKWSLGTEFGSLTVDRLVLAMGAWTPQLLNQIGYRNPIAMERGYHCIARPNSNFELNQPIYDVDGSYVMSQMEMGLRITTGSDLVYSETDPTPVQIDLVLPLVKQAFPIGEMISDQPWMGRRPTAPDSLPLIGPAPRHPNLWLAFAHSHMGLTMGPMTGRMLGHFVRGENQPLDITPYLPSRYL
ncbi:MAG: D-amino-acid dehydrogenase [Gammaproteobacteria bacterium]|jgi:D-amino-acid dehydrogenase